VELPGRGARFSEPPFTDVRALARVLVPGLVPAAHQPYALFGHSFGALLAFEIARVANPAPVHLFVSAHRAPNRPLAVRTLCDLPETALFEELASLGGIPEILLRERELMRLLLPAIRADLRMTETYTPDGPPLPLPCPVTAFAGISDQLVPAAQMKDWVLYSDGRFSLHEFDGGHFYLQRPDTAVFAAITEALTGTAAMSGRA